MTLHPDEQARECFGCQQDWYRRRDGVHESKAGDLMRCKDLGLRCAVSPKAETTGNKRRTAAALSMRQAAGEGTEP